MMPEEMPIDQAVSRFLDGEMEPEDGALLAAAMAGDVQFARKTLCLLTIDDLLRQVNEPDASAFSESIKTRLAAAESPKIHEAVAILVNEEKARFAVNDSLASGRFEPGDYELQDGTVQLRFASGAEVIVQSPARFKILDRMNIALADGVLRAIVPSSARGFTVHTSEVMFEDLGTEFGVAVVNHAGESQLHVFEGRVDLKNRNGQRLSSAEIGQSVRVTNGKIEKAALNSLEQFPTPIFAWIYLDRCDYTLNSIFTSDGWKPGALHLQVTRSGDCFLGHWDKGQRKILVSTVPFGRWTHVAVVADLDRLQTRTYVNGELAEEVSLQSNTVSFTPGSARLGDWFHRLEPTTIPRRGFRGRMDEFGLLQRVLTQEEIREIVVAGSPTAN